MSEKRKDSKGRILKDGEYQRSDGKYEYKYTGPTGARHSVYSWRLVETDKLPAGKRQCVALREQIKKIQKDLQDGIMPLDASKVTLNQKFQEYLATRDDLRPITIQQYQTRYKAHFEQTIGQKPLQNITYADIRSVLDRLAAGGMKLRSIRSLFFMMNPVFEQAVTDNILRTNPANGVIKDIARKYPQTNEKRHALTVEQQTTFLNYVKLSRCYSYLYPLFVTLLGTGCRIGEALGLRWEDCDFDHGIISIDHTVVNYRMGASKDLQYISKPKTVTSIRQIPMLNDVKTVLLEEYSRQQRDGFNTFELDGYSDFIFASKHKKLPYPQEIDYTIGRICKSFNKSEEILAQRDNRPPIVLPHFSVHNLRHTFCTRMCENETNLKIIQEIMGHSNISTTMDIYNEATMDKKKESFSNLELKMKLA